jgi:hypothetical protein
MSQIPATCERKYRTRKMLVERARVAANPEVSVSTCVAIERPTETAPLNCPFLKSNSV